MVSDPRRADASLAADDVQQLRTGTVCRTCTIHPNRKSSIGDQHCGDRLHRPVITASTVRHPEENFPDTSGCRPPRIPRTTPIGPHSGAVWTGRLDGRASARRRCPRRRRRHEGLPGLGPAGEADGALTVSELHMKAQSAVRLRHHDDGHCSGHRIRQRRWARFK